MRLALPLTLLCILAALAFVPHKPTANKDSEEMAQLRSQNAELRRDLADSEGRERGFLNDTVTLTMQNATLRSRRCSTSLGK